MEFSAVHTVIYEGIIPGKFLLNVRGRLVPVNQRLKKIKLQTSQFRLPYAIYLS
jgi:hypothetical protein